MEEQKRLNNIKKKVEKKVESKGSVLTKTETKIYHLLTQEYLSPKRIALRRKCSFQAVYKIIKQLKDKGIINKHFQGVEKSQCTLKPNQIRLHGQEFNIKILWKDKRYKGIMSRSNIIYIDGNTVRLFKDSIEVYSGHSFFGDDPQSATSKSFGYWNKLFIRLENDLKVNLIKPRKQNIRMVKHHYSEVDNEYADECEKKGYKIRVFAREDSKLWFMIDNSFNLHEAETQHPDSAKYDMEKIKEHFNDIRENNPPTITEIMGVINKIAKQNNETATGLNLVVKLMGTQPPKPSKDQRQLPEYIG